MSDVEKQKAFEEEAKRISETISKIKHRIAVFSGKGGVGKTTVAVNLAYGFHAEGFSTGILDADITGPNVAKMLGVDGRPEVINDRMLPSERDGVKMISMAGLLKKGQPLIWRGPVRSKVIHQFLADVEWGELDYMIADLPPGTGDEILSIGQQMKPDYAVIVTTPQEVSVMDAERAVTMAQELQIPFIGIVENMSGLLCPHCGKEIDLFGKGGGEKLARDHGATFLGSVPMDLDARILSDEGKPVVLEKPDCDLAQTFKAIANLIAVQLQATLEAGRDNPPISLRDAGYSAKATRILSQQLNFGALENPDIVATHQSDCGDKLIIYLKITNQKISNATYEYVGCRGLQAAASALTEMIKGKTLDEALKIDFQDVLTFLEGIPPSKYECIHLAVHTLREARKAIASPLESGLSRS
jgi:ATP-binding protein involved in chromosome partitioning